MRAGLGCSLLTEELRQIGFKLSVGEVERKLVSRRRSAIAEQWASFVYLCQIYLCHTVSFIPSMPIVFPNTALLFTMLVVLSAGFLHRPLRSLSTHTPSPTTSAAIFTIARRGIGIRREFRSSDYKRMMRSPLITIEADPGFAPSPRNNMIPD